MMSRGERLNRSRILTGLLDWAPICFSVLLIASEQPFFGNFDDGLWLRLSSSGDPRDLLEGTTAPGLTQIENGTTRFLSQLIIFPLYWASSLPPASLGALILFALNTLLVVTCFAIFLDATRKIFFPAMPDNSIRLVGYALLWPFAIDLLFFPSLQEKVVVLGVGCLLHILRLSFNSPARAPTQVALTLIAPLLFATKTHVALFAPILMLGVVTVGVQEVRFEVRHPGRSTSVVRQLHQPRPLWTIFWLGLIVIGSVSVLAMAILGEYSRSTRGSPDVSELLSDWRFLLILVLLATHQCASFALAKDSRIETHVFSDRILARIFGAAIYLPFLMSFLVWEIRNYYLSVLAPAFALTVNLCLMALARASRLRGVKLEKMFRVLVTLLCVSWVLFRLPMGYGATSSFREFLTLQVRQSDDVVYVMCGEAQGHFNYYTSLPGFGGPSFEWVGTDGQYVPHEEGLHFEVLADEMFCPLDRFPLPADVESAELLWTSSKRNSYQLWGFSARASEDQ